MAMRTIEIRRHSFTKKGAARGRGSHLSRDGVAAARELGASLGPFDLVVASTSPRTTETALAMGHSVDELIEMPSPVETGEIEFHAWREWPDPFATLRTRARDSTAVRAYIRREVELLLDASMTVGGQGRVLVVGHGGWIESVVAGLLEPPLTATAGGSFWHLDGIRLEIDEHSGVSSAVVDRYPRRQEA